MCISFLSGLSSTEERHVSSIFSHFFQLSQGELFNLRCGNIMNFNEITNVNDSYISSVNDHLDIIAYLFMFQCTIVS